VTLQVRRERDKSSTSFKGRRQWAGAIGDECRGVTAASSSIHDVFGVLCLDNGAGDDELAA
jgi:hypothetical protein